MKSTGKKGRTKIKQSGFAKSRLLYMYPQSVKARAGGSLRGEAVFPNFRFRPDFGRASKKVKNREIKAAEKITGGF